MPPEPELLDFIRTHIKSVWALEILLLLRREEGRAWPEDEVVRKLRASRGLVAANLAGFERSGLVKRYASGACRYAPVTPVIRLLCDELDAAYRERPVAIINIIAAPEDRLQQLAEAFRFKDRSR